MSLQTTLLSKYHLTMILRLYNSFESRLKLRSNLHHLLWHKKQTRMQYTVDLRLPTRTHHLRPPQCPILSTNHLDTTYSGETCT